MARFYVFGPVASRRLGASLGVDLVEPKTCSLNCVYCEAKETTCLTTERKPYVPAATVIGQLDTYLAPRPALDFITFSGAGEPLLNSEIGPVIRHLKRYYPQYRICLLTNAVALSRREVWDEIAPVDLVIPSLDASDAEEFRLINRPEPGIVFSDFVASLAAYTQQAKSEIHLELFVVPGVNDSDASIARFAKLIRSMKLASVQLNTLDRPGAVRELFPAPEETLERFVRALDPIVPTSPIRHFRAAESKRECADPEGTVLGLIERRPSTGADVMVATGLSACVVRKLLEDLKAAGKVVTREEARGTFYEIKK